MAFAEAVEFVGEAQLAPHSKCTFKEPERMLIDASTLAFSVLAKPLKEAFWNLFEGK